MIGATRARTTAILLALAWPGAASAEPKTEPVTISLYKAWASDRKTPPPCPAELKKFEKLLREKARRGKKRFNAFRLEEKPATRKTEPGKRFESKLPAKHKLTLTPTRKKDRWTLEYHLESEDSKWSSKLTIPLKDNKPIIVIPDIQQAGEQFVMVIVCDLPGGKRPDES